MSEASGGENADVAREMLRDTPLLSIGEGEAHTVQSGERERHTQCLSQARKRDIQFMREGEGERDTVSDPKRGRDTPFRSKARSSRNDFAEGSKTSETFTTGTQSRRTLQGYLAHKKQRPPRTLQ